MRGGRSYHRAASAPLGTSGGLGVDLGGLEVVGHRDGARLTREHDAGDGGRAPDRWAGGRGAVRRHLIGVGGTEKMVQRLFLQWECNVRSVNKSNGIRTESKETKPENRMCSS